MSGEPRAHDAAQRIESWIRSATGGDPTRVRAGYHLDGSNFSGTNYVTVAFVAPLGVGAMVDAANQTSLNAVWDLVVATPVATDAYHEKTLKLLAMIVVSGNWWAPAPAAPLGGCDRPPRCPR